MKTLRIPTACPLWPNTWCKAHARGYNITRSFYSVPKANGHVEEKTREVTVVRHHEDTPLPPGPVQKQHLF